MEHAQSNCCPVSYPSLPGWGRHENGIPSISHPQRDRSQTQNTPSESFVPTLNLSYPVLPYRIHVYRVCFKQLLQGITAS